MINQANSQVLQSMNERNNFIVLHTIHCVLYSAMLWVLYRLYCYQLILVIFCNNFFTVKLQMIEEINRTFIRLRWLKLIFCRNFSLQKRRRQTPEQSCQVPLCCLLELSLIQPKIKNHFSRGMRTQIRQLTSLSRYMFLIAQDLSTTLRSMWLNRSAQEQGKRV